MSRGVDVVLLGHEPEGSENLSVRLLAAAVCDAGLEAKVQPVRTPLDAVAAVEAALAEGPLALGLSLQDSQNAVHAMALAVMARRRGYRGFIVAGGPFATLQTRWVLDRVPALDGVIRHQGEEPLVALLGALKRGGDLGSVPGLVTREQANPPASRQAKPAWRPLRGRLPRVMGVPTAHVIAGKGCHHRCDYCTHAAVASMVVRECRDAGATAEELRRAGLGRPSRRPVFDLAAEMAELYHGHGVRYFEIIDESPLPHGEAASLEWIASLRRHLEDEGVGDIALGMMTRGDQLTKPVVEALASLGLVRTFVGVESGHDDGLRGMGRRGDAKAAHRGLQLLAEHGILASCNVLVVQPDSTKETVAAEIDALEDLAGALFESVQVRPFVGTRLHERMVAAGRLDGGSLLPSFRVRDPAVERFRVLSKRLATEAMGHYTTSFQALDLLLSTTLAARFTSNPRARACDRRAHDLVAKISAARVEAARQLVSAAVEGEDGSDAIARAAARFAEQRREMEAIARLLQSAGDEENRGLARHYRNLAAAASFVFAVATGAACNQHRVLGDGDDDAGSATGSDNGATDDGGDEGDTGEDDGSEGEESTGNDPKLDVGGSTGDPPGCEYWEDYSRLESLVFDNCGFHDCAISVIVTLDERGRVTGIDIDDWGGCSAGWVDETRACYFELLAGEEFPCLAGEEVWIEEMWGGGMSG